MHIPLTLTSAYNSMHSDTDVAIMSIQYHHSHTRNQTIFTWVTSLLLLLFGGNVATFIFLVCRSICVENCSHLVWVLLLLLLVLFDFFFTFFSFSCVCVLGLILSTSLYSFLVRGFVPFRLLIFRVPSIILRWKPSCIFLTDLFSPGHTLNMRGESCCF